MNPALVLNLAIAACVVAEVQDRMEVCVSKEEPKEKKVPKPQRPLGVESRFKPAVKAPTPAMAPVSLVIRNPATKKLLEVDLRAIQGAKENAAKNLTDLLFEGIRDLGKKYGVDVAGGDVVNREVMSAECDFNMHSACTFEDCACGCHLEGDPRDADLEAFDGEDYS